jgi:hypothetical protein
MNIEDLRAENNNLRAEIERLYENREGYASLEKRLLGRIQSLEFEKTTLEGNLANAQAGLAAAWDDGWVARNVFLSGPKYATPEGNPYRPSETPEHLS